PYIDKGYPIGIAHNLKEGIFATPGCAAIAKGHPDKREVADAFINEALGADAQTRMAQAQWFGPTNRKVKLTPDVARNLVSTQAQWDTIIPVNLDNLAAHREEWVQKITRALLGGAKGPPRGPPPAPPGGARGNRVGAGGGGGGGPRPCERARGRRPPPWGRPATCRAGTRGPPSPRPLPRRMPPVARA